MTNSTPSPTPVSDDNADALIRSKTTVGAAEEALVALLLSGSDLWPVLDGGLSEDQFATPSLRQVFAAILRVDGSGSAIDPVTVAADLEETSPGCPMGVQELQKLTDTAPRFTNKIETYLNQIAAAATRRALADAGRNIVALAGDQKNKVADALTSAESEVLGLRVAGVRSSATPLSALIPDVLKTLESRKAGELLGLSSGLASLDDANGGLKEQELVIIAARPGMGKSVLALQMARDIAARDGRCYFASYEMSGTELTARLLSREIQAPAQAILRNDLDLDANLRLADAARALSQVDLVVDDAPPSDVTGLVAHIRSQHARSPFTAVFVDYLQLIDGRGTSRVEQITYVSRQLKLLAVALGIPVVALSQLSRNLESRPDKRPILSDLRDSGAIEQDANQVLAIYRPSLYESDADDADAELLVLKNRSGVPGITVKTEFHGAWSLFRDIGSAATKTVRTALASGGGGWGGNTSPF